MILSGTGARSILDLSSAERRKIRQKNIAIYMRMDKFDRRHKAQKLADARQKWDRFIADLRRERDKRIILP